jgi:hypothetical protein
MQKKMLLLALLTFFIAAPPAVYSQDYGVAVKVSTLGVSLEGIRSLSEDFNARIGFSYFSYSLDGGSDDYNYDASLQLLSFSILGDWFPFQNALRLTGGIVVNLNEGDLKMNPKKSYTVGGTEYTPEMLGGMTGIINFNKVAPYLGFGIGNPVSGSSGLSFSFDLGAIYQGSPNVDLKASGLLTPSGEQGPLIEENLSWFKFYPVLSFGLSYKF